MAKKVLVFDIEDHLDFELMGIICAHRDFRLCFEINETTDLGFRKTDDLQLKLEKKHSTSYFSLYQYINLDGEEYFLITNRGTNGLFIPEQKHIDYFLLLRNKAPYTSTELLLEKLKSITIVNSALQIDPGSLKSADHFLYIEAEKKSDLTNG